jgi:hypothetical protein
MKNRQFSAPILSAAIAVLFLIAVPGGSPQRLGDYPGGNGSWLSISADNRHFLVSGPPPEKPLEFWSLQNVIPKLAASAKAPAK